MMRIAADLWQFLKNNKKFWLLPIILILGLLGGLLILAKSPDDAPFRYAWF